MSENKKNNNVLIIAVGLPMLLAVVGVVILAIFTNTTQQQTATPSEDNTPTANSDGVSVYDPPKTIQDFTMSASTGETVSLSDFRGKLVLIAFGYTRCPDVCPTNMLDFRQVKRFLAERADNVVFLLISVDGERDTPDLLRDYLVRYDPAFIGLSGTDAELNPIKDDYGLYYARIENPRAPNDYMVDHTASRFLVDAEGRLIRVYSFTTDARVMARDIVRVLVNE
ncbi:MAG: SCO family protein [bacterium]|nr:SCO family protein [bacterium]